MLNEAFDIKNRFTFWDWLETWWQADIWTAQSKWWFCRGVTSDICLSKQTMSVSWKELKIPHVIFAFCIFLASALCREKLFLLEIEICTSRVWLNPIHTSFSLSGPPNENEGWGNTRWDKMRWMRMKVVVKEICSETYSTVCLRYMMQLLLLHCFLPVGVLFLY